VAVDCLLNKEQQAFSQMSEVVKITLSDKNKIDYEVKDQPFTSLCDYSESCQYECINKAGTVIDRKTYTYDSAKNSKIIDRIKELFTMKHVYHEEAFKTLLKTRNTNSIEIERAIYNMINDKEILIDKFGKKGYLININNLYLYQPIEIKDKHVTMYERMNPITYKPKMVELDIQEQEKIKNDAIGKLMKLYNKAKNPESKDDWYDHYFESLPYLKEKITDKQFEEYLIYHICETFSFEEEIDVINIFFKTSTNPIENIVKQYYKQFIIKSDDITGIILLNHELKDPIQIYVLNDSWTLATYEEKGILSKQIKMKMKIKEDTTYFKWIGYMGIYKGSYDFKIVNTELEKLTSAVFENKGRSEMYKILNETVGERNLYNKSPLKKIQLSIIQELYLRIFDEDERHFLNKL
jgi:hypothetical protein